MPEPRSTGLPKLDAQNDFLRARRHAGAARLAARLRGEPDDVRRVLPYDEVIDALGFVAEHRAGTQVVALDAIVGSVDRGREFDRSFRPTSGRVRSRWEYIATAMRRGESMPPVDLVRLGDIYFVRDGHHRVSVARALGRTDIDARVTDVVTRVGAERTITLADLPFKSLEREFFDRVPLPDNACEEIRFRDPWDYPELAETIEAWGFRLSQEREAALSRREVAYQWLETDYRPVVEILREENMVGKRTETEAYMAVSCERYRLLRTQSWDAEALARLVDEKSPRRR